MGGNEAASPRRESWRFLLLLLPSFTSSLASCNLGHASGLSPTRAASPQPSPRRLSLHARHRVTSPGCRSPVAVRRFQKVTVGARGLGTKLASLADGAVLAAPGRRLNVSAGDAG